MNAEVPLPELRQAQLDPAGLAALLRDIAECTELLAVLPKQSAREHSSEQPLGLPEAAAALRAGALRGVQLRYRHDGAEWWDTLLAAGPDRWRLVRMRQETA